MVKCKLSKVGKKRITVKGILQLLDDVGEVIFPMTRKQTYRNYYNIGNLLNKDYFPSEVKRVTDRLERQGLVSRRETVGGTEFVITNKGKTQVLKYRLAEMKPKRGKWDGKWRVVFFDIDDIHKRKRDDLRAFLEQMGFKKYQESVYLTPFDYEGEVEYLRELLEIPHEVKIGVLEKIENEEELREMFEV